MSDHSWGYEDLIKSQKEERKRKKNEKEEILRDNPNLKHVRFTEFKLIVVKDDKVETLFNIIFYFKLKGYYGEITSSWTSLKSNRVKFNFEFNKEKNRRPPYSPDWLVDIDLHGFLNCIADVFKFMEPFYKDGYVGSNEWKQDSCKKLKIPLKGKLKCLIPRYYNNRLDLYLRFLEKRFNRDIRVNLELSITKKNKIREYLKKLDLIKSVFEEGILLEIKRKLIYNTDIVSKEFEEKMKHSLFI